VEGALIPLDELGIDKIDFVMTNPPFYASEAELLELGKQKERPPNSACTGAPNEMVCDGGEIGFIRRIIAESLILQDRVQWYTSMLGKQSSLEAIVALLKGHDIGNYAVTKFVQGNKTRRWAIGWSFSSRRPNTRACRGFEPDGGRKMLLPPPTESTVASKATRRGGAEQLENIFWTQLEDVTDGLDLVSWELDEDRLRVVGFADQNVWGRAYRRSKTRRNPSARIPDRSEAKKNVAECAFGFSICIETQKAAGRGEKDVVDVVVRWLQGTDYAMFESFFGMLRNALLNVVA
jgi:23S rRNA (adenine1618-N6)-methyltransferase